MAKSPKLISATSKCHLQCVLDPLVPPPMVLKSISATSNDAQIHQCHIQEQPQPGEVPLHSPPSPVLIPPHPTRQSTN